MLYKRKLTFPTFYPSKQRKESEKMNKTKSINLRVTEEMHTYLKQKCKEESLQLSPLIEKIILHDMKLHNGYVDDLAAAISNQLSENLKTIRRVVFENNKMLQEAKAEAAEKAVEVKAPAQKSNRIVRKMSK
jgi:hypothetical protein